MDRPHDPQPWARSRTSSLALPLSQPGQWLSTDLLKGPVWPWKWELAPHQHNDLQQMQGQEGAWTPLIPQQSLRYLQKHTQCHLQKHSIWKLPKSLWNPRAYFQFQVNSDKGWMGQSATASYMPQQHLKQTLSMQAAETQLWVWEAACAAVLSSSLLTFWICPQCMQTWVCPSSSYTSCWGLCSLRAPTDQDPEKGPLRVCSIILGFYLI